jgi:hypothetical protein
MSIRSVTSVTPGVDAGGDQTITAATASTAPARSTVLVSTAAGIIGDGTVTAITAGAIATAGKPSTTIIYAEGNERAAALSIIILEDSTNRPQTLGHRDNEAALHVVGYIFSPGN